MVTTSVIEAYLDYIVVQMNVNVFEVNPSTTTPAQPVVTVHLNLTWYDSEWKIDRPVVGAPCVLTITNPNGVTTTATGTTDSAGDVSWDVTLDVIGTWQFQATANEFTTNIYRFLGCETSKSLGASPPPISIAKALLIALGVIASSVAGVVLLEKKPSKGGR